MRVLHSVLQNKPTAGVVNQMTWEQNAAHELMINWNSVIYCQKNIKPISPVFVYSDRITVKKDASLISRFKKNIVLRNEYWMWLLKQSSQYDVIVLRYLSFEIHQLLFVFFCKKPVYFIHHTKELSEIRSQRGSFSRLKLILEKFLGRPTLKRSTGIVGVTPEIVEYEMCRSSCFNKTSYVYPNGVGARLTPVVFNRSSIPELLFVASYFYEWHGLDILLDSLKLCDKEFVLHLVGSVSEKDMKAISADKRIFLHGELSVCEINEVAKSCWIGLASFALFRKNMREACTLKVREYLSMGLPVYSGHRDVFPDSFEYYHFGLCNIEDILQYAYQMKAVENAMVVKASMPFIDKKLLLSDFYQFICMQNSGEYFERS